VGAAAARRSVANATRAAPHFQLTYEAGHRLTYIAWSMRAFTFIKTGLVSVEFINNVDDILMINRIFAVFVFMCLQCLQSVQSCL